MSVTKKQQAILEEIEVKFSLLKDLVESTKECIADGSTVDAIRSADQGSIVARSLSELLDKIDASLWIER